MSVIVYLSREFSDSLMQKLHVGKATAGKILRGEIYDDESLV